MAIVANNNLHQVIKGGKHFDLPVTTAVRQGTLVYWDAVNKEAKEAALDADCATLLGVSLETSPVTSNIDNGVVVPPATVNAGYDDLFLFNTTVGETFENFTEVYIGADGQTVTATVGTNKVGYVRLPSGETSVTGAAGVRVPVMVESKK